jgi:hypothetical protein
VDILRTRLASILPGALISSVVEEYNLAFCYPGIFLKDNLCVLAALRETISEVF